MKNRINQHFLRYYALAKDAPREIAGYNFKGPGSCWEWCSSCRVFEHVSVFVPEWWQVTSLNIDHVKLTVLPDLLDAAVVARWLAEGDAEDWTKYQSRKKCEILPSSGTLFMAGKITEFYERVLNNTFFTDCVDANSK